MERVCIADDGAERRGGGCRYPGNDPAPGLDDSLPGYYGFDPLGFIQDEESKRLYQQAELVHCRSALGSLVWMFQFALDAFRI